MMSESNSLDSSASDYGVSACVVAGVHAGAAAGSEHMKAGKSYSTATMAQMDSAAAAAAASIDLCADMALHERASILRAIASFISANADAYASTLTTEILKSGPDSRLEVERTISTLSLAATATEHLCGHEVPLSAMPGVGQAVTGMAVYEPLGPILAISGFNFPLLIAAHKIAAAIGAGCPILVKPSERAPATANLLADAILAAGWHPGAISVLHGGAGVVEYLLERPEIALVTFTGSTRVGRAIAIAAASSLKRVVLELGSNAATVIAPSADIPKAASRCVAGGFSAVGQSCISVQRVIVHRSLAARFREELVKEAEQWHDGRTADGLDVGYLIDVKSESRVASVIEDAVEAGARIAYRGKVDPEHIGPTVLDRVTPAMRVAREEVFGPVLGLMEYEEIEEAIMMVNDSDYGLQCGIFTNDLSEAMKFARRVRVGGVNINEVSAWRADHMPYGGIKNSGYGKEGPAYAMREMSNLKMISCHQ